MIRIYLNSCMKYNAPKRFEMLRGITSIWVFVLTVILLAPAEILFLPCEEIPESQGL